MDETEFKLVETNGKQKSAIIYRDDSVSDSVKFVYICFHCGLSFINIDCTLQHIESHFRIVKVAVDERNSESACDDIPHVPQFETVEIKSEILEIEDNCEIMEIEDNCGSNESISTNITDTHKSNLCKLCDSVFPSKFLVRSHILRVHFNKKSLECDFCSKKFKRNLSFERHLSQHMQRNEVNWHSPGDGIRKPLDIEWPESDDANQTSEVFEIRSVEAVRVEKRNKKTVIPQPFKCHVCSETYRKAADLKNHFKSHRTSSMLQINRCTKCDLYFQSIFDLRLHVLVVHLSTKILKCSTCSMEFQKNDKKLFEEHLRSHLASNSVAWANICEGICQQGNDLTSFQEILTCSEERFACESCTEKFYIKSNLDEHIRKFHSKPLKLHCGQCDSIFTVLKHYFAHQMEHQRVGANITERDKNVLLDKLNACIEEQYVCNEEENKQKPYSCLVCSNQFLSQYDIRRHVRLRHVYKMLPQPNIPKRKNEFACNICGTVCKQSSYRTHLLTHSDNKIYECEHGCGRKFRNKSDKIIHERLHTGEKPYQCSECGKRFPSKSLLTAHKISHDNSKYPCTICGRVFNVPSGYRRHIQTHRKDKAFECSICLKSFNTRVYLTRHMFKHSEKNFSCKFCNEKFNTANGKRQHERIKHNYEPS